MFAVLNCGSLNLATKWSNEGGDNQSCMNKSACYSVKKGGRESAGNVNSKERMDLRSVQVGSRHHHKRLPERRGVIPNGAVIKQEWRSFAERLHAQNRDIQAKLKALAEQAVDLQIQAQIHAPETQVQDVKERTRKDKGTRGKLESEGEQVEEYEPL